VDGPRPKDTPKVVPIPSVLPKPKPRPHGPVWEYVYSSTVEHQGRGKAREKADMYALPIYTKAVKYRISPILVASLVKTESHFDRFAVSSAGALGLAQIMPFHFESHGYSLSRWKDPWVNMEISCRLLHGFRRDLSKRFPGSSDLAVKNMMLVAYNMGQGAVVNRGIRSSHYSRTVIRDAKPRPVKYI
jgi:soluble lytic murein transglycosylase-like protein